MDEELKIIIGAETADVKKGCKEASKEINTLSQKAGTALKSLGQGFKKAGEVAKQGMKMAAGAIAGATTALLALGPATEEYRQGQAKLNTAFESAGGSAKEAEKTYNDLYRVLGDSDVAVEAANHLAKLTTNQQELSEWTNICQGVYATFGDSLPIEGLTEAANETAKTGALTGGLADALNWAGVAEEEFQGKLDACNSEAEREKLIRETLNGLYSEASKSYEKNAKSILDANEAQAQLSKTLAELGAVAEPIITVFKVGLNEALQALVPGIKGVAEGFQSLLKGFTDTGTQQIVEGFNNIIDTILNRTTEMLPVLLETGVKILKAVIEGIAKKIPDVIKIFMELIPTIVRTIADLLPTLLDAGVKMITTIIEGLTKTIPDVIKTIAEMIPEIIKTIIEAVPKLLEAGIELFLAIVDAIGEVLPDLISALPDIIDTIVDSLIESLPIILDAGIELFLAIVDAIPEIIPALVEALPEIIDSLIDGLIDAIPLLLEASVQLFMAIVEALPKIIPALLEGVANLVSTFISNLGQRLWSGIQSLFSDADYAVNQKVNSYNTPYYQDAPTGGPGYNNAYYAPYATGGVFDQPTLFSYGNGNAGVLGEAGAEAVVPLENNTEWLDRMATMLNEKMGHTGPIVMQVDGKTFAEISCNSINDLTRQQGYLALNVI